MRYARSWKEPPQVERREVAILRDGVAVEATLTLPRASRSGRLPGWIAVGGMSRMGRFHPQLVRFADALASSGAAVLVPEIPEWRRLQVSPEASLPTVRAAVEFLNARPDVEPRRFGVIGFSFGAPGVALAASHEEVAQHMAGIVLFGGYCSLARTVRCMLTGEHDWEGVDYDLNPDPYGRWVVGSNHLTRIPGHEDAGDVADALRRLAYEASGRRVSAWEPCHDRMIRDLRCSLPQRRQALFDHFATPSTSDRPNSEAACDLAGRLAEACRRAEPLLDPAHGLAGLRVPTQVIHGQGDRLVPFTEGLRLMESLPAASQRGVTVTPLFNHSKDHAPESAIDWVVENARLFGALRRLINTV